MNGEERPRRWKSTRPAKAWQSKASAVVCVPLVLFTCVISAAWAFVEEHKSEIGWDLVTLQPPYICHSSVAACAYLTTSQQVFGLVIHKVRLSTWARGLHG